MSGLRRVLGAAFLGVLLWTGTQANGFFLGGNGHYGARGVTRTNPAFDKGSGQYQAVEQSFSLFMEARASDTTSFNLNLGIFPDPRQAYLGDQAEPSLCSHQDMVSTDYDSNRGRATSCKDRHQSTGEPGYRPYEPRFHEAFAEHNFEYCILTVGRKARSWGMGVYLDAGRDPFDTDRSVFDGIGCDVNLSKTQTKSVSFGYDKLTETGTSIDDRYKKGRFGATRPTDDLDQIYFSIEYDDRKANAGKAFNQHVGFYVANILGRGSEKTDIKVADFYVGLFGSTLSFENEVVFRLGKSTDPSWALYGGSHTIKEDLNDPEEKDVEDPINNKVDTIASAGKMEWTLSQSGSYTGPKEYKRGTFERHLLFFEYAYAPGSRSGYTPTYDADWNGSGFGPLYRVRQSSHASAFAFHPNFKPALILFNGLPEHDHLRVDGVFDPTRLMNVTVLGTGYRFESLSSGDIELKFISAQLNQSRPDAAWLRYYARKAENDSKGWGQKKYESQPVGFSGRNLGWEFDINYNRHYGKDLEFGLGLGAASPGSAWKTSLNSTPRMNYLIQSSLIFQF